MRSFSLWLVAALILFGSFGGGYHYWLSENPRRVAIIVDTSFPMQAKWPHVSAILSRLQQRPYTRFLLRTEKGPLHDWLPVPRLRRVAPYAPRDFSGLESLATGDELDDADEVFLITNAAPGQLASFTQWEVIRP